MAASVEAQASGEHKTPCLAAGHLLNAPVAAAAADRSLNVLVKLSERQCNPTTGLATATALQNAIAQATAHGLQYLHPVGARSALVVPQVAPAGSLLEGTVAGGT